MAKYCQNCGNELNENQVVCLKCGVAVPGAPQPQTDPQPQVTPQQANQQVPGRKSKMAAGLLGIFLGALGVHNFYLGYTGKAVVQLLISILSCGFLALVSEVWGLVEGIMILTGSINVDGKGNPLGD